MATESASPEDAKNLSLTQDLSLDALFGIRGKNCVVTGGSKGIGLMIASGLVQNGASVWIFSRKPDHDVAAQLTELGPGKCTSMACDISSREAIDRVVADVASNVDSIHLLVNNSGATWGASFEETPKLSFDKLLAVNLVGLFECSQAFMNLLQKDATAEAPASIINIASIDGMRVAGLEECNLAAPRPLSLDPASVRPLFPVQVCGCAAMTHCALQMHTPVRRQQSFTLLSRWLVIWQGST